jgi:hypothetical protein
MELSQEERLMLSTKKEEIKNVTNEILDLYNDPKNATEIKKRIMGIQSLVSTIGSYSKSKKELDYFITAGNALFNLMMFASELDKLDMPISNNAMWTGVRRGLETYCSAANSLHFDFTESGIKLFINIESIIKEASIFRTGH